jgi:hypothetical protein
LTLKKACLPLSTVTELNIPYMVVSYIEGTNQENKMTIPFERQHDK